MAISDETSRKWAQVVHRAMNVTLFTLILIILLNVTSCADRITVTNYDGWLNACELAGGVNHAGRCFDPSALIEVEVEVEVESK